MESRPLREWLDWSALMAAGAVFVIGVVVLLGWASGADALKSVLPQGSKMSPLSALTFTLCGLSLWLQARTARRMAAAGSTTPQQQLLRRLALGCAAIAACIGAIRLGAQLLGRNPGMDLLWFHESADVVRPARMAPTTAANFLLLGCALLMARRAGSKGVFLFLNLLALMISWLGLSLYLYGGEPLLPFGNMALHTALAFLLLSLGTMCIAETELTTLLTSDSAGGDMARRLVPATLIVPVVLGWLRLEGQRAGWYGTEAGVSLLALGNVLVFGALVWASAARLRRADNERRRAEESRREGQLLLQAIVDNSPAVIYVKDLAGRYLLVNKRYEAIAQRERSALLGKTDYDLFPRADADGFRAMDQRVASSGRAIQEEEAVPHRDGMHTYVSVKCPLLDQAGNPYAVFGISTDISDRKHMERRLQVQLGQLDLLNGITRAIGERHDLRSIFQVVVRSLEDNLPIDFGCICLRHEESTLEVQSVGNKSAALAQELGMGERALIPIDGNGLSRCLRGQLVYEPDIAAVPMPFPQRLAQQGLRSLVIAPLLVESNVFGVLAAARREAHGFSSPDCEFLRQLSQHVALAAHQAQIHTALKQAYDDLRQTQEAVMQQERLRSLGQMASGIAHDINNSISPISLYTEYMLETETGLSAQGRKHLEVVRQSIDDVAATVARMREFYRPRLPQSTLAPVQLNQLVQQVVDLTRARWSDMAQQRGVMVEMRIEAAPQLPAIRGIEGELREALTNLIFNAVDAMPEGGTLTVRTDTREAATDDSADAAELVTVAVMDTGVGMSEEVRRRCLEPFFTTKGERGTGLGLATVYGTVQRHGAEIDIDSAVGKGTAIRLIFPAAAAADAGESNTPLAPLPPLRILIVDDDPLLLRSLRDTLEADGHSVHSADGGQRGIDAFRATLGRGESFAAVITDLGMPYVDGRKVAQSIKEASPSTPVVLLTGWGQRMRSEGEIPPHVDRVLGKPPKLRELRETLAAVTQGRGH